MELGQGRSLYKVGGGGVHSDFSGNPGGEGTKVKALKMTETARLVVLNKGVVYIQRTLYKLRPCPSYSRRREPMPQNDQGHALLSKAFCTL